MGPLPSIIGVIVTIVVVIGLFSNGAREHSAADDDRARSAGPRRKRESGDSD